MPGHFPFALRYYRRLRCWGVEFMRWKSQVSGSFDVDLVKRHYDLKGRETIYNVKNDDVQRVFRMVLPPPNVTGNLHIGHALTVAIEDSLCRYNKLIGSKVTWCPGFDHAGIATQTVVERLLFRETKKRRHEVADEEFLRYCDKWKNLQMEKISAQLDMLGADLDWSKLFYTMDEKFSEVVVSAFCYFHESGLIFRAERPVNWCPILKSTISDQEIEEIDGKRVCTRSGGEVTEVIKEQWFLHCEVLHQRVLDLLSNNKINIKPDFVKSQLVEWLRYSEPWCLSRQLLWGHRIPAYYDTGSERWIVAKSRMEAERKAVGRLEQDSDVLDTWFSSSLIPLVVAGWPHVNVTSPVLEVMETGHDIIGFWVARMLALCNGITGCMPFTNVVLHGLIRDSAGRKMSKSLGNVIDPLDVINGISLPEMTERLKSSNLSDSELEVATANLKKEFPQGITKCGSDGLRFAFFKHKLFAADVHIDINRSSTEGLRFCNKLWNLVKYTQTVLANAPSERLRVSAENVEDKWLMSRFKQTLWKYHDFMETFEVHAAFETVHDFILSDLCDVYLELTKQALWTKDTHRLAQIGPLMDNVVGQSFQMLSTFLPFVSNYLLDQVFDNRPVLEKKTNCESHKDVAVEHGMNLALSVVQTVRSLRNELKIGREITLAGTLADDTTDSHVFQRDFGDIVSQLANFYFLDPKRTGNLPHYPCVVLGTPAVLKIAFEDGGRASAVAAILLKQLRVCEVKLRGYEKSLTVADAMLAQSNQLNESAAERRRQKILKIVSNAQRGKERVLVELEKLGRFHSALGNGRDEKKNCSQN